MLLVLSDELVALAACEIMLPYSDPRHRTLPGRGNAPWIDPQKNCLVKPDGFWLGILVCCGCLVRCPGGIRHVLFLCWLHNQPPAPPLPTPPLQTGVPRWCLSACCAGQLLDSTQTQSHVPPFKKQDSSNQAASHKHKAAAASTAPATHSTIPTHDNDSCINHH